MPRPVRRALAFRHAPPSIAFATHAAAGPTAAPNPSILFQL
jgi:hypothetical protein